MRHDLGSFHCLKPVSFKDYSVEIVAVSIQSSQFLLDVFWHSSYDSDNVDEVYIILDDFST